VSTYSNTENQVRQTPGAYAPDAAFTTSPCIKGFSGGLSFPGGAGTAGFSKIDKGCDSRQTAVVFHAIGNDSAAAKLLCSTDAAKRAHLTLEECATIVKPQPVIQPSAPSAPAPQVIVVPQPAPVITGKATARLTLHVVGSCKLPNGNPTNACYRVLDDAVLALQSNPDAKIVLTGPVESGKVVPYLQKRISANRIQIRLADEQNWNLNIDTEVMENE
jgi:hypothetical protein